jgi:hypothetical protein
VRFLVVKIHRDCAGSFRQQVDKGAFGVMSEAFILPRQSVGNRQSRLTRDLSRKDAWQIVGNVMASSRSSLNACGQKDGTWFLSSAIARRDSTTC